MKKAIVFLMALLCARAGFAQDSTISTRKFKVFKVDISGGYAIPQGSSASSAGNSFSGGALFAIEPKFAVVDPLAIGIRVEAAVTAHLYHGSTNSSNSTAKANLSYILTMDYYFTNNRFRPFIGGGAGIYSTAEVDSTTTSNGIGSVPYTSQFGGMVRAGFEFGHLRIAAEYNFVANDASYIGLKLGVCIGGGRRKR
ncbi:MAG TPA: hypothetical protein VMH27_03360 [Puia sp.]|nr:hypothetical protein [Puia sp.]